MPHSIAVKCLHLSCRVSNGKRGNLSGGKIGGVNVNVTRIRGKHPSSDWGHLKIQCKASIYRLTHAIYTGYLVRPRPYTLKHRPRSIKHFTTE